MLRSSGRCLHSLWSISGSIYAIIRANISYKRTLCSRYDTTNTCDRGCKCYAKNLHSLRTRVVEIPKHIDSAFTRLLLIVSALTSGVSHSRVFFVKKSHAYVCKRCVLSGSATRSRLWSAGPVTQNARARARGNIASVLRESQRKTAGRVLLLARKPLALCVRTVIFAISRFPTFPDCSRARQCVCSVQSVFSVHGCIIDEIIATRAIAPPSVSQRARYSPLIHILIVRHMQNICRVYPHIVACCGVVVVVNIVELARLARTSQNRKHYY